MGHRPLKHKSQVTILVLCVLSLSLVPSSNCSKSSGANNHGGGSNLLHEICLKVEKGFKSVNSARCLALLSSDPKASAASKQKDLAVAGLEAAMKYAIDFEGKINATIKSKTTSPELKASLTKIGTEVRHARFSFRSALMEVKAKEFMTANYDCFVVPDSVKMARYQLAKAKGRVDPFVEEGLATLEHFAFINYEITN